MYKYKTTTDVEVTDLVIWTESENPFGLLTKNKVYQVTKRVDQDTVYVVNDMGAEHWYCKALGFKVLQTKPAKQAVVGDYMYRVSSGNIKFPQFSIIKITKIDNKSNISNLYYASSSSVSFNEVIVIAQAEPEVKYPYFTESKEKGKEYICKVLEKEKYIYIHNWVKNGCNKIWNIQPPIGEPCDFKTEPEIFDIDWWQGRFEAGLPVYAIESDGTVFLCKGIQPKKWYRGITFSMTDPSLVQQAPTIPESAISFALYPSGAPSEPTQPTTKEQPMNKTTLKLLLELLGASEEVKDATNSKFVGIITNEDEYVGYMYFDSKEDATECMAQPKMELHKLHLFEKSCVLAQKPRKVIEV